MKILYGKKQWLAIDCLVLGAVYAAFGRRNLDISLGSEDRAALEWGFRGRKKLMVNKFSYHRVKDFSEESEFPESGDLILDFKPTFVTFEWRIS